MGLSESIRLLFLITVGQRLQCVRCGKVRYRVVRRTYGNSSGGQDEGNRFGWIRQRRRWTKRRAVAEQESEAVHDEECTRAVVGKGRVKVDIRMELSLPTLASSLMASCNACWISLRKGQSWSKCGALTFLHAAQCHMLGLPLEAQKV